MITIEDYINCVRDGKHLSFILGNKVFTQDIDTVKIKCKRVIDDKNNIEIGYFITSSGTPNGVISFNEIFKTKKECAKHLCKKIMEEYIGEV